MATKILICLLLGLGLKAMFPSVLSNLHTLFKDYLKYKEIANKEQKQKELDKAKENLKNSTNNGDLNDLIDSAKKIGEIKRK